ncbi:peroxiredoxin [Actinoplanes utahensis]|uniref:thioredoxin-dependent peroxiredoxin n=1 Tax=Actinoplanes utahensis TaxID=1869 RepID=A0A0A6UH88_ACTUT|nr:peroxiredoxin [Actinoplanes utahensis]KHD73689.1 peroxiredoxin [Actinoplanes utahensis]
MSIGKGEIAPDFEHPDQDGTPRRLSELVADGPVVLFFYPGAMTKGCTAEACHFRDLAAEYRGAGVQRVGISRDPVAKQKEFAETYGFDYPLLSDPESTTIAAYGVKRKLALGPLTTKRMTFVIGADRTVLEVIHSEMDMHQHAAQALHVAKTAGDRQ